MGPSGFTIFAKAEQGQLLAFAGKPIRASHYAIGNPLLAIAMVEHAPEIALYAPLRITVYDKEGNQVLIEVSAPGEPKGEALLIVNGETLHVKNNFAFNGDWKLK
jgi:uncharacterized protein (DUF302 family)